jgi:hypothetical protein
MSGDDNAAPATFSFGEWMKGPDGTVEASALLSAQAGTSNGAVVARIAVVTNRQHMDEIRVGKSEPAVHQLQITDAALARRFGSQLIAAATRSEGRNPTGIHLDMHDDGSPCLAVAMGDGGSLVIPLTWEALKELHREAGQLVASN